MGNNASHELWRSYAETCADIIDGVHESLDNLKEYLHIDINAVALCTDMVQHYVNKLEPRKNVQAETPPELQVVLSLLNKVNNDIEIISDIIDEDIKALRTE